MKAATTRHGQPLVSWGSWNNSEGAARRKRRRRGEALRRIEGLEDRRLLAAGISIDAASFLRYDGDALATEGVTVTLTGSTYRFTSNNDIVIGANAPGLPISHPGGDPKVVEVEGITGMNLVVYTAGSTADVESTAVPTAFYTEAGSAGSKLTVGDSGDLSGIAAQVSLVNAGAVSDVAAELDGSAGTTAGAWTLQQDGVNLARLLGFGATGAELVYTPSLLSGLTLKNAAGQANKLTVNFDTGTPLPVGTLTYDGGSTGGAGSSDLVLIGDPGPDFDTETYTTAGAGAGSIELEEEGDGATYLVDFSGLSTHSVYDTVPAVNYVFNYTGDPDFGVLVAAGANSADTGDVQTLGITSASFLPAFADTHVANKTNVTINQTAAAASYTVTLNYGLDEPVAGLAALTVNQGSGDDAAEVEGLPPDATFALNQGGGNDTATVQFAAAAATLGTTLDGGPGTDRLTIDVDGLDITPANFFVNPDGSVTIRTSSDPDVLTYNNYESIVIDGAFGIEVDVTASPIAAVQGVRLVDAPVGTFRVSGDAGIQATAAQFGATIAWGDGSTSAGTIVQDASDPTVFYVYGTHTYTGTTSPLPTTLTVRTQPTSTTVLIGSSPVTFNTLAETGSDGDEATITATELAALVPTVYGVPIHGVEGGALTNALVGAFTSSATATAADFVATVAWGDGTTTTGTIVQDASNPSVYYIYGSHTYYAPGQGLATSITVKSLATSFQQLVGGSPVTFFRPAGAAVSQASQAFIDDAPIDVAVNAVSGFENIAIATSDPIVATFTDLGGVDPSDADPAAGYTATIYWGDGSAGVGAVSIQRIGTTTRFIVTAAPHIYATPGSYPITVVVAQAGEPTLGIGTGVATIADAPLNQTSSQPTIPDATEGVRIVDARLGSFVDANPLATTDQFTVTVDWGDGTGLQAARVIQPGGVGTTFYVVGSHTYASSIPAGGAPTIHGPGPFAALSPSGSYAINIAVKDAYGSAVNLYNTITVLDRGLTVSGALSWSSDTGISRIDGITNDSTPTFTGRTSEGGATVWIYSSLNGAAAWAIGSTTSDASGAWSFTPAVDMADGGYTIQAQAYDAGGHAISSLATLISGMVVDTVGPKVTDVVFDNIRGQVLVSYQDFGGVANVGVGLAGSTLRDANNYRFVKSSQPLRRWLATSIAVTPGTTTGEQLATVQFNGGLGIRGGRYGFRVLSVDPSNLSGVQDIAGNALDGEYYGYFPSGNNVNGGDFAAYLDAIHRTIYPASSQVGTATPVSPPGRPATGRTIGRGGALLPSASSAVTLSSRQSLTAARAARIAALAR